MMQRRHDRPAATLALLAMLVTACGQTVLVRELEVAEAGAPPADGAPTEPTAPDPATDGDVSMAPGGPATAAPAEGAGGPGTDPATAAPADPDTGPSSADPAPQATAVPPAQRCADGATDTGVTEDEIVWGTILPLSGPTRPLGEQTARVMKRSVNYFNTQTSIPSRPDLDWGCPDRPGIYGRTVRLEIASISSDSEDDVLAAMRRLVDVEEAFLVRDCYLQASLMGPAHQFAESRGVTTYHCYPESLPQPQLQPHTWALGTGSNRGVALMVGHLVNQLGKTRIGMLYDPTYEQQAEVVRRVAEAYGAEVVEEVQARAQTAVNGRRSEVIALRSAQPDAVLVLDALNATYAGVAAGQIQWRPQDSGVVWACNKCWLKFQVDVCGDNCAEMLTTTAGIPFAENTTGAKELYDIKRQILPGEPNDVLTFAALLITSGLFIQHAEVGPDLTRAGLEAVFASQRGDPGGGLPPINTGPDDHMGGTSDWIIEFTGESWPNGFADVTGEYISLADVGVDPELARS